MVERVHSIALGFEKPTSPNAPEHWILMVYLVGTFTGTYYHAVPAKSKPEPKGNSIRKFGDRRQQQPPRYIIIMHANKRVDAPSFSEVKVLSYIAEPVLWRVIDAAMRARPQESKEYVLETLGTLEGQGIVPLGTVKEYGGMREESGIPPTQEDGEGEQERGRGEI
ncbi:hypothetical protein BJY01DRAFT_255873 [Aspergillus pseudoustus]|uniref:Uncharacterized protein n=1 Tax=Aspergillus pseudoustus TaxID=1810923 RepID=A0ABR4IGK9_9EURO